MALSGEKEAGKPENLYGKVSINGADFRAKLNI